MLIGKISQAWNNSKGVYKMSVVFNEELKYCIGCRWCKSAIDKKYRLNRDDWKCLHPKNISVDLLTGWIIKGTFHPDFLRGNIRTLKEEIPGSCGVEGKWFEKKVKVI